MPTIKKNIKRSFKTNKLEVSADFSKEKVVFHPLPANCQSLYRVGQKIRGHFGRMLPTGKVDSRNVPIYKQFFIPEGDW